MKKITLITTILMVANLLVAQIINIPADYPTIQEGIDATSEGDTVLVDIGTYYENIHFSKITVASHYILTQDTSYISQTIIDGDSDGSVVSVGGIYPGDSVETFLCGFTIRNGKSSYDGGGISIAGFLPEDNFYFTNLIIENNIAEGNGGGIYCVFYGEQGSRNVILRNVIIRGNIASWGSGIACTNSSPVIQDALIINNLYDTAASETYGASVLYGEYGSKPELINATITKNFQSPPIPLGEWVNLIVCDSLIITNSIIYNNGGISNSVINAEFLEISYSNIQEESVSPGEGNINEDPLFIIGGDQPYQINDYSPCIDAGTPDTTGLTLPEFDLVGNLRIVNNRIDMGAYEWNMHVGVDDLIIQTSNLKVQTYPNPFYTSTTIEYTLSSPQTVTIIFYNQFGKEVDQIEHKQLAGKQQVNWVPELPGGVYYFRLEAGEHTTNGKLILMR